MENETDKIINHDECHSLNNHDSHTCDHHHVDIEEISGARLLITLFLNLIIPVVQIIGAIVWPLFQTLPITSVILWLF
ncbi:MAG: hypothetical protein JRJ76_15970 [Deltaproteobacteria bacterium]|nr:hypothetical protein [Deltaproteobacteria bacterium]